MRELRPTQLLEGTISGIKWKFGDPESDIQTTEIEIYGGGPIHIPSFYYVHLGDWLCAICAEDQDGRRIAVDLIRNDNRLPISVEQRSLLLQRVGAFPLYTCAEQTIISPAIQRFKELELALIAHLKTRPHAMRDMNSDAFEQLVAELLASFEFHVQWTGRNKKTAGDVWAVKVDGSGLKSTFLVECKRYSQGRPVGVEVARALWGAKADEGFSNALLVTTSSFQDGVEKFAMRHWDFQKQDFNGLLSWLNHYRPRADGKLHMQERKLWLADDGLGLAPRSEPDAR